MRACHAATTTRTTTTKKKTTTTGLLIRFPFPPSSQPRSSGPLACVCSSLSLAVFQKASSPKPQSLVCLLACLHCSLVLSAPPTAPHLQLCLLVSSLPAGRLPSSTWSMAAAPPRPAAIGTDKFSRPPRSWLPAAHHCVAALRSSMTNSSSVYVHVFRIKPLLPSAVLSGLARKSRTD